LYGALDELKNKIVLSDLPETSKLDYLADVETMKVQLAKPHPEKNIIKNIWEKISTLSQVAGFISLIERIYRLLELFLR
jgi:hypothetical protein